MPSTMMRYYLKNRDKINHDRRIRRYLNMGFKPEEIPEGKYIHLASNQTSKLSEEEKRKNKQAFRERNKDYWKVYMKEYNEKKRIEKYLAMGYTLENIPPKREGRGRPPKNGHKSPEEPHRVKSRSRRPPRKRYVRDSRS